MIDLMWSNLALMGTIVGGPVADIADVSTYQRLDAGARLAV